jgi:hypothetical protein
MAIPIYPFPKSISRSAFGHWLSGFVDGEGSFMLTLIKLRRRPSYRGIPACRFEICLRQDDYKVLELIRSYWGFGSISEPPPKVLIPRVGRHPVCRYYSANSELLGRIAVPHFDRFPLRSKKARDFVIWKSAIEVACTARARGPKARWKPDEFQRFLDLADLLRRQRAFGGG